MTRITSAAHQKEIRAKHKTFDVASSGRLFISVPGADLELSANDSEEVAVDVYVNSHSENEALAILDRIKLRLRAIDRQTVRIESRSFYAEGFIGWKIGEVMEVKLAVSVPRTFNLDLQAAGSRVELTGINGRLTFQGSGGSFRAKRVQGRMEIYGHGCDVSVENFKGSTFSLAAAASTVEAHRLQADSISINASSCTSSLEDLKGHISLYLHSGQADIRAIKGPLEVDSHGCATTLFVDEVDDTDLAVRGGDIDIQMPGQLKARLLLEGKDIYLDDKLPFSGKKEEERIKGQLNKGKNLLHANAAAASIRCVSSE